MLRERIKSILIAGSGIWALIRQEDNAKIHLFATISVLLAGWYFSVSKTEWLFLILCITGVFAAEAFNTALEELTDLVSPDYHPLAGKAKDFAAAAVLLIAIGSVIIGIIIFLPKAIALFNFR